MTRNEQMALAALNQIAQSVRQLTVAVTRLADLLTEEIDNEQHKRTGIPEQDTTG